MKGLVTGTKVNILGTNDYLWTVNYYDDKYRTIQSVVQNHKDSLDRITNIYDFVGKVIKTKTTHSTANQSTGITRTFTYDHAGRLLKTYHKINDEPEVLLSSLEYNELGELVEKKLHSTDGNNFKQHVDFRYNIRGWLTRINNSDLTPDDPNAPRDHFGMNLHYNDVVSGIGNTPQYNGNISATKYSTNQGFDPGLKERAYKYDYDAMSRLTAATHLEKSGSWNTSAGLHEDNITYNLNTSMLSIRRKGADGSQMDNLAFTYNGNQLQTVTDSWDAQKGFADGNTVGNDYTYDANGNRITDKNKGITAYKYNYMNQREKVTFSDGNYLLYIYDAAGNKLSQGVYNSSNVLQKKTDYVGEFFYENDTLKYISHEEGRYNGLAGAYEYELRDHLGNNRVTFTTKEEHDEATATVETDNMTEEQSKFLRYENARRISSHLFDKTNGSAPSTTPGYAVRLNGTTNEKYGLARSFAVVPGDTVKAEVYVKYIDTNNGNWTTALNTLLTQIAGGTAPAGTVVDGGSYGSSTSSFPFPGLLNTSGSSGEGPKAYLNWLVFDKDFVLQDAGYVRMSDAAKEYGQDVAHEKLQAEFALHEPGYVYLYLSNENETPVEVYFDDWNITHVQSPVVEVNNYYPYGAVSQSYQREGSLENKRFYQGKELVKELGLEQYDFGPRLYNPWKSITTTQDPHAESYFDRSPYSWCFNNPVRYDDPTGKDPGDKVLGFAAALVDNIFGGFTPARSIAAKYVSKGGASDFNTGQDMGDVASMVMGVMMVEGGTGAATGGTLVTVGSGGLLGEVGVPVALVGTAVAAEGVVLGVSGAASLGSQKGRLNAEGKTHGNKLDDKPAEGYTLKDKKTGDTKKYGETTRGEDKFGQGNQKRYTNKELNEKGVEYKKEASGTKKEMHQWQHKKILEHKDQNNGKRPDLNKSDY